MRGWSLVVDDRHRTWTETWDMDMGRAWAYLGSRLFFHNCQGHVSWRDQCYPCDSVSHLTRLGWTRLLSQGTASDSSRKLLKAWCCVRARGKHQDRTWNRDAESRPSQEPFRQLQGHPPYPGPPGGSGVNALLDIVPWQSQTIGLNSHVSVVYEHESGNQTRLLGRRLQAFATRLEC